MEPLRQLVRMPAIRTASGVAALACAAAALAACGATTSPAAGRQPGHGLAGSAPASTPPASVPAGPGTSTPAGATASICLTSELKVTLDSDAAGAAAGTSYMPLEFTNVSAGTCVLNGYPAVAFASGAGGPQIGTAATAAQAAHSAGITLGPGEIAHAWLQIADVASYPASKCKPVQASGLRVAPSGTQATAFLPHSFQACANSMPGSTLLAVFPVQPGQAQRGTAP
jgi:hypothetical protein